jgi:hypothetical protein
MAISCLAALPAAFFPVLSTGKKPGQLTAFHRGR